MMGVVNLLALFSICDLSRVVQLSELSYSNGLNQMNLV